MYQDWKKKKTENCERSVLQKPSEGTAVSNTSEKLIMLEKRFVSFSCWTEVNT